MTHPELIAARRNIALGKINAFNDECWRLAQLIDRGALAVADAVDALAEADVANSLSETFGPEIVQEVMADAFAAGTYGAARPSIEVAA